MNTDYISPAFFIRKANGKLRLVFYYRHLNEITIRAHNIRLKISDMLYKLRGSKIYTKLDLDQGFYQIRVKSEDIPKTGFRIMGETYVFLRMPFGLTNVPYKFQKTVNKTLEGTEKTYYYIDDILIASKDIEAHYYDVKRILDRLEKHKFCINFNKRQF
ncbi:Retrovirus-related Pol polyprotein from transposon opus [Dictyocoela muelleri]|nr:Retrovirus-related Pol polyprotein from transposon opus [Dictyocoela muelleri]